MARKASISVLGDASSYLRSLRESAAATDHFEGDMRKLAVTAKASADAQIQASVRKDARLREEIVAYRAVASAASAGSKEQVVAANLAAQAEGRLARSLGVTAVESVRLRSSLGGAERDMGRFGRGVLAGSGALGHFSRAAIFASNAVLGGVGLAYAVRSTINAAEESQRVLGQTANATRRAGLSWKQYGAQIQEAAKRQSLLSGFDDERLLGTFSQLVRRTGDVNRALMLNALATDVARGRNIELEQAQQLVLKASIGQAGALRRLGINAEKGASGLKLIDLLQKRYAGSAAAYGRTAVGAQDRFAVAVENTKELLGNSALPTLTKYLNTGADWLSQSKNQARIQHDLGDAVTVAKDALGALHDVATPVISAFRLLGKITGGTKKEIELLGVAFLVLEARAKLIQWGLISGGIEKVGGSAATASGSVGLLSTRLASLAKFGLITVGIEVLIHRKQVGDAIGDFVGDKTGSKRLGSAVATYEKTVLGLLGGQTQADFFNKIIFKQPRDNGLGNTGLLPNPGLQFRLPRRTPQPGSATPTQQQRPLSLAGRFNLAELRLANAEAANQTKEIRTQLVIEAAIVKLEVASAKTLKDKTSLTQQLSGILSQIRGIDEASAQAAKQAAADAKQQREENRKRLQDALQAREFKVLNLDPTGQAFTPGFKALRRELGSVDKLIKGTSLDTTKNKGLLGRVDKLLFGKDASRLTKDVRSTVKQMLDALNDELKNAGGPETRTQKANSSKFFAGLGLSPAAFREARARLSRLQSGGRLPVGGAATPAGGFGGVTVIHTHVKLDGREVGSSVTRTQQKTARRNPAQKRGPHVGGGV